MKTRTITAAVLVPVLFLIVLAAPKIAAALILGLLLAVGAYELLYRTGLVTHTRLVAYSAVMSFGLSLWSYYGAVRPYFLLMLIVFFMLLFGEMMREHIKIQPGMLGCCFLAGVVIPYLLTSFIRILVLLEGRYVILIPFVVGFLSDAGAYFVGCRFGKHKLAPVVSPKKTVEGVGGGLAAAVIGMLLYAFLLQIIFKKSVYYPAAFVYAICGSLAGTFGDLCFSIIKRQTGIKDYGNLMPGHGGVMDRFDSLTLVAPLMEALILLMPIIPVA